MGVGVQPSTINHQPSNINHQPSTINHQPSTINHQPSPASVSGSGPPAPEEDGVAEEEDAGRPRAVVEEGGVRAALWDVEMGLLPPEQPETGKGEQSERP